MYFTDQEKRAILKTLTDRQIRALGIFSSFPKSHILQRFWHRIKGLNVSNSKDTWTME